MASVPLHVPNTLLGGELSWITALMGAHLLVLSLYQGLSNNKSAQKKWRLKCEHLLHLITWKKHFYFASCPPGSTYHFVGSHFCVSWNRNLWWLFKDFQRLSWPELLNLTDHWSVYASVFFCGTSSKCKMKGTYRCHLCFVWFSVYSVRQAGGICRKDQKDQCFSVRWGWTGLFELGVSGCQYLRVSLIRDENMKHGIDGWMGGWGSEMFVVKLNVGLLGNISWERRRNQQEKLLELSKHAETEPQWN